MQGGSPEQAGSGCRPLRARTFSHSAAIQATKDMQRYTKAEQKPMMRAPEGWTLAQPAVTPTRPASSELHVWPSS